MALIFDQKPPRLNEIRCARGALHCGGMRCEQVCKALFRIVVCAALHMWCICCARVVHPVSLVSFCRSQRPAKQLQALKITERWRRREMSNFDCAFLVCLPIPFVLLVGCLGCAGVAAGFGACCIICGAGCGLCGRVLQRPRLEVFRHVQPVGMGLSVPVSALSVCRRPYGAEHACGPHLQRHHAVSGVPLGAVQLQQGVPEPSRRQPVPGPVQAHWRGRSQQGSCSSRARPAIPSPQLGCLHDGSTSGVRVWSVPPVRLVSWLRGGVSWRPFWTGTRPSWTPASPSSTTAHTTPRPPWSCTTSSA
jgi:hypothetical protein